MPRAAHVATKHPPRKVLLIAAALLVAEIERLDRTETAATAKHPPPRDLLDVATKPAKGDVIEFEERAIAALNGEEFTASILLRVITGPNVTISRGYPPSTYAYEDRHN